MTTDLDRLARKLDAGYLAALAAEHAHDADAATEAQRIRERVQEQMEARQARHRDERFLRRKFQSKSH